MVDMELAEFSVGESLDISKALELYGDRIEVLIGGKRWHVTDFVAFHYGVLSGTSKLHMHVIALQQKHGIGEDNQWVSNGYPKGMDTLQRKNKYKDKDIDTSIKGECEGGADIIRDVDRLTPDLIRVKAEFLMNGSTEDEAERFYNHYDAQDWKSGNGQRILKWQAKAKVWIHEQRTRESKDGKPKKRGDRNTDGSIGIVAYSEQIDGVIDAVREARRSQRGLVRGVPEEADDMAKGDVGQGNNNGMALGTPRDGV